MEMGYQLGVMILVALVVIVIISTIWKAVVFLLWRPYALTRSFSKQGVKGPEYKFRSGSLDEIKAMKTAARDVIMDVQSHDIVPRILPHYGKWLSQYGETFLYWFGTEPRICITDAESVKQILSNKFGFFTKANIKPPVLALLGKGLVLVEGLDWVRHRRIVNTAFTMDKLKLMTRRKAECTLSMLDGWQDQIIQAKGQLKEIEMNTQFHKLTADVICHTAFGSSYQDGKEVFLAQKELQSLIMTSIFKIDIPGYQYLPTRRNLKRWELERKVRNTIMRIIQSRLDSKDSVHGNDLLGIMMEASTSKPGSKQDDLKLDIDEIIDECKTFFFAGHETTSHLLTWTMFLLSSNQDWQEKLREEVSKECGTQIPDADMVSKLKLTTMVLLEALRLYCPVIMMMRKAAKEMKLGNLTIPKDTAITIPVAVIHRSRELWGDDANEFNPLRFENGISKAAKHPNALISFSLGPRACVGQNFAMLEAKMVMTMILQRFSFSLSPQYKHAPADMLTLQPQFGLPIVLRLINK